MKSHANPGFILVTGGAGFIGQYLVRALRQHKQEVLAVDNLSCSPWDRLLTPVDVRDVLGLSAADLRGARAVIHLASRKVVPTSFDDPSQMRHNVAVDQHMIGLIAAARPVTALLVSSCEVYGSQATPLGEDSPRQPRSPYAVGKVTMEMLVDVYRSLAPPRFCVARLFNVFGPGEGLDAVVPRFVHDALTRGELLIEGTGTQRRDFTYVDDVVKALTGLLELSAPPPVINIASGVSCSIRELAHLVGGAVGLARPPRLAPARRNEIAAFTSDTRLLRRTLPGWRPEVDLAEGLARCIAWQRAQEIETCAVGVSNV